MSKIFFNPWIGQNYFNKGYHNKRVLVVGDSHACTDCAECGDLSITDTNCRELTTKTVNDFLRYKKTGVKHARWMNTFSRFTNVILNKSANASETQSFWESIAFFNYVQYATDRARKAPTDKQYEDSFAAFLEILEKLKPDLVIVWGKRLWYKIPDIGSYGNLDIIFDNNNYGKIYYLPGASEAKISAFHVPHPSTPQFTKTFCEVFNEVFKKC